MKRALAIAALSFSALLLVGCSASSGSSGVSQLEPQADGSKVGVVDAGGGVTEAVAPDAVITVGQLTMTVTDPIAAADAATALASGSGGKVSNRADSSGDDGRSTSTLTVRVPADQLTGVLDKLRALGDVGTLSLDSTDVTGQVTDLSARITALQTSVDRLLGLMTKATSTDELLSIEKTLSERQSELDSLTAQRAALDDQVSLSTVTVTFYQPGIVAAPVPDDFGSGLAAGWAALLATLSGALVAFGVLLPWLVLGGIIAGIVVVIVRLARRRRPSAELPAA